MIKYVVYYSSHSFIAIEKDLLTPAFHREMKGKGYKKHHVEVEAFNKRDAILKLKMEMDNYHSSLKDFSVSIAFCSVIIFIVFLVDYFRG